MSSKRQDYIGQDYFLLTLLAALAMHLAGLYVWYLTPGLKVVDVPVHVLNIKLGDAGEGEPPPQPAQPNNTNVEDTISHLVRDQAPVDRAVAKAIAAPKSAIKAAPPNPETLFAPAHNTARQFVRDTGAAKSAGAPTGNSAARDAEIVSRYEQLISLWIQKFKLYPDEARNTGQQGDTVVRIRIDRQGNIRYYVLERSTGFPLLDHAAIDMIRRANPVPAVPTDYPQSDLMEFLIPVSFHLQ
ncbi:MAG: energy transducer TonB [Pseudomonadota bacterium]|nr:energy transducer TonB [Pseudomonadota bacterium]